MKAQNEKWPSLHEMLFENRNKQYGAYVIRREYNDTVVKSLLFTICFFLSLVISAVVYNKLTEKPEVIFTSTGDGNIVQAIFDATPKAPEPAKPAASKTVSTFVPPIIVDHVPVDDPDNNVNQNSNNAPVAGNSNGTDSSGTGTGNIVVVPPLPPPVSDPVVIADEMPVFKGGMDKLVPFLSSNMMYPERAKLMGIEGTVFVSFVVDEEGNVGRIKILKGIGGDCDEEAMRVVAKMPKWKPGRNAGQNVKVMFNLPIRFVMK
jgi:protein TonB